MKQITVILMACFVLCLLTGPSNAQDYDPCESFTCPLNAECRVYGYEASCFCQDGYVKTIDDTCEVEQSENESEEGLSPDYGGSQAYPDGSDS